MSQRSASWCPDHNSSVGACAPCSSGFWWDLVYLESLLSCQTQNHDSVRVGAWYSSLTGRIYHPDSESRNTRTWGRKQRKGPKDLTLMKLLSLTPPQDQVWIPPQIVIRNMLLWQSSNITITHIILPLLPHYDGRGGGYDNVIAITMMHQQQWFCGKNPLMILG